MLYSFSMTEDIFLIVDNGFLDSSIPPSLNPTPEVWAGAAFLHLISCSWKQAGADKGGPRVTRTVRLVLYCLPCGCRQGKGKVSPVLAAEVA
jgi:hypothetical protein